MKSYCYRMAIVKKELLQRMRAGRNHHDMFLTREQAEYLDNLCEKYRWKKEEILHRAQTKCFKDIGNQNGLLKKIHKAKREGKETIMLRLSSTDEKMLKANGVKYWPVKFRVYFRKKDKTP